MRMLVVWAIVTPAIFLHELSAGALLCDALSNVVVWISVQLTLMALVISAVYLTGVAVALVGIPIFNSAVQTLVGALAIGLGVLRILALVFDAIESTNIRMSVRWTVLAVSI